MWHGQGKKVNNKCWHVDGEIGSLYTAGGNRLTVQTLENSLALKSLKTGFPRALAILFLGI